MELQHLSPVEEGNRKFSLATHVSLDSTTAGETSSESVHSSDDNTPSDMKIPAMNIPFPEPVAESSLVAQGDAPTDLNSSTTSELQTFEQAGEEDDDDIDYSPLREINAMPSTREPSPEPRWANASYYNFPEEYLAEEIQAYGRPFPSEASNNDFHFEWHQEHVAQQTQAHMGHLPRKASPSERQLQRVAPPKPPHYQMMLVVPNPVLVPPNRGGNVVLQPFPIQTTTTIQSKAQMTTFGVPMPEKEQSPPQLTPLPASTAPPAPALEKNEKKEKKEKKANPKKSDKGRGRERVKGHSMFDTMSEEQKETLCKYIYEFMVEKEFTSPEGYLIVDVFSEVWKDVGDSSDGWRVAQHRFGDLLRSAPQYFRLFRRSIRVANQCGWFARKGEKMVRLVLDEEK
jgi:hypothetical protein